MDFLKIMKISLIDIGSVDYAQQLQHHAEAIIERLGYTPKEAKIAKDLVEVRKRALEDYKLICSKYHFEEGKNEIFIENNAYMVQKLTYDGATVTWSGEFFGITDHTQTWNGKVVITERELFELYKTEYLYENHKEDIPGAYVAYFERCYGLAGMFKNFVNATKAR